MASLGNVLIILEDETCLHSLKIYDSPNQKAEFKKKQQESVKAEGSKKKLPDVSASTILNHEFRAFIADLVLRLNNTDVAVNMLAFTFGLKK
ncbi:hypothetical protein NC651_016470 [Populus alba x Populus x berolinensis]|nr:hypothetical protein NC651_016470 [Populus alba x Populus x berolinensis]